ncbi:MAG TPA: cation-translocating P-type ATPase [Phycisphaerales bacterium]|nr:cation-translocating P-type ATPase [Phycisphaerales bacterium]HMP37693.1 cation-translocating P-type ATPase [Phycisphaerales bacterium]
MTRGADPAPAPATTPAECAHCGAEVPRGLLVPGAEKQFCCQGCRCVHELLGACGFDRYYALREAAEAPGRAARVAGRDYLEFDDPAFEALHVRRERDGLCSADLFLEDVHCAACLWLVERLARVVPGVIESRLDLRRSLLRVRWDPLRARLSAAARALDRMGHAPHPARAASARRARRAEERRQLVRLGVAGACAGNVMLLALALYAGLFGTMDPAHAALFRWISMGLSVTAVAWPGSVFFRGASAALRSGRMHLDLPIAVGLAAGTLWGVAGTILNIGEAYFDSLSVLVFALLMGRYVQQRQLRWSADSVELLFSLTPTSATLVKSSDDPGIAVPIERIARGDLVLVAAGGSIPADGVVAFGSSAIDRSLLTGESLPATVSVGDEVPAGAVNRGAPLRVRVTATGEETRIGRLMRLVEEAARDRAPIVRLADRLAGWFAVTALALAALTTAIWWHLGPAIAIDRAVALLVVTCPCGLGLATPLAVTVAIGRAARRGILIKGGEALERLASRTRGDDEGRRFRPTILLDKTGTITTGRLAVVDLAGDPDALRLAALAERDVDHPVAEAIRVARRAAAHDSRATGRTDAGGDRRNCLEERDVDVIDRHAVVGGGVSALIDGRRIVVGSPGFVRRAAGVPMQRIAEAEREFAARGLTPVLVAVDGRITAAIGLGDSIRADASASIARLRSMGWRVEILSGDHQSVVDRVGAALGIGTDARRGGATPEAKLEYVRARRDAADGVPVAMVGDGVNDAAALAAATVGIAVHGGAEASLAAADVHLGSPGLAGVADLVEGSRRTLAAIRRNLIVSLGYNAIAAWLCIAGVISPLVAAIIMPISSLSVVALSLRARTFEVRASSAGSAREDGRRAAPVSATAASAGIGGSAR